jgi:hypothetical protein
MFSRSATIARAAWLALLVGAALYVGCSTSNGDPIPEPDNGAPDLDAGGNSLPSKSDAASTSDAAADADSGAPVDAANDGPDPVSAVRIGEIYVDNVAAGDPTEFIELRGAPGTSLDELRLRLLDSTGAVTGEIDVAAQLGDVIPASGLWVVGGGNTFTVDSSSHVDHVMLGADLNAWGMDTPRGAVQLVRGTARALLDVVGYDEDADAGALASPSSPPIETVEGKPAVLPSTAKKSFGRVNGAIDGNDNRADFCQMAPTAGRLNAACE